MFGIHDFGLFVVSGLLLNLTPGVDFLYVLGRGYGRGFRAGLFAALGIGAGCFVHILAAALGLSALLASSARAFAVLKWLGAGYLIIMGAMMLRQRVGFRLDACAAGEPHSLGRVFGQGLATNVLNPKVALFFLAFVPQFIAVHSNQKVAAFLVLGTVFNTTGTIWNVVVAWGAGYLAGRLDGAARFGRWLSRCLGAMFMVLGAKLALAQRA